MRIDVFIAAFTVDSRISADMHRNICGDWNVLYALSTCSQARLFSIFHSYENISIRLYSPLVSRICCRIHDPEFTVNTWLLYSSFNAAWRNGEANLITVCLWRLFLGVYENPDFAIFCQGENLSIILHFSFACHIKGTTCALGIDNTLFFWFNIFVLINWQVTWISKDFLINKLW